MTDTPTFKVLIIGGGQIAGGFDEQRDGKTTLSHMGAYSTHSGFYVAACVEPNAERRAAFMDFWKIPLGFATLEEALANTTDIHIASVCSPTANHLADLEYLLNNAPHLRAVLCEKPIGEDLDAAEQTVKRYRDKSVALLVNYFRRWDHVLDTLRADVIAKRWGQVQNITAFYGKGILHNGSHIIDLLTHIFGALDPVAVTRSQSDHSTHDPSLDVVLKTTTKAPVYLIGTNSKLYDLFEIYLTMETAQIVLEGGATVMRTRHAQQNPNFPSHRNLERGAWTSTALNDTLPKAIANLYSCALRQSEDAPSTGTTALQTHRLCQHLLNMSHNNQDTIL